MKRLHIIIYMCLLSIAAQAQEPGEQLLVFRNTGVVDLLYTDEVDSILTTDDSQVFYAKDTVLVVPFAELDSVAVGSRNEITFHPDVKELTDDTDLPWIIRFDGQSIYYSKDTPPSVLPNQGMKLFYGLSSNMEGIFPYGLCAKVTAITHMGQETKVDIETVKLEDIFSHLFLAGPINAEVGAADLKRRAPVNTTVNLDAGIDLGDVGSIEVRGSVKVSGNVVIRLRYQHADLTLDYGYGTSVKLKADTTYIYEEFLREKTLGTFYKLLNIEAAAGAFFDLAAELSLGVEMERTYSRRLLWTRKKDDNSFEFRNAKDEPYEDKASFAITLDGSIYFGPMLRIDFVTIGDLIGARAKLKLGPEIEGKISLGIMRDMRNYQPEAYGNAKLSSRSKVAVEGYTTNRHNIIMGEVDEHKIFSLTFPFAEHSLTLFPEYTQTAATTTTTHNSEVSISAATALPEPPLTDIETGFEIVDPQGEVVDSVFVGTILAEPEDTTVAQTFDTEIPLPPSISRDQLEGYTLRPVFHYAGYTVSAAPVGIKKDVLLQRFTSTQSNGAMTFISSGPFLASAADDSIHYQLGAWLPVPLKHNVYKKASGSGLVESKPILDAQAEQLIGTWQGSVGEEPLTLTLHDDGTGMYNGMSVTYQLNYPQSGEMLLTFENNTNVIYRIFSVTEQKLMIADKREPQVTITLMRVI